MVVGLLPVNQGAPRSFPEERQQRVHVHGPTLGALNCASRGFTHRSLHTRVRRLPLGDQGDLQQHGPHRVAYSVGFTLPFDTSTPYHLIPERVWTPALDSDDAAREGSNVAEFTDSSTSKPGPKGCG